MKPAKSASKDAMLDVLKQDIDAERVVIFSSNLTDIRPITTYLRQRDIRHRVVRMGMRSQAMRDRFARLRRATGWHKLPQIFVDGWFIGGYDEFFAYDFGEREGKARERIPIPALILGASGLIPFLFGAAALWVAPHEWRADILRLLFVYGAVILTFTGAVHWGLALRPSAGENSRLWQRLSLSVVPALVAWLSFSQIPVMAFGILIGAYLGQYLLEVIAVRFGWAPAWYLRLRSGLTGVAIVCLFAGLFAVSMQQGLINSSHGGSASGALIQNHGSSAVILIGARRS